MKFKYVSSIIKLLTLTSEIHHFSRIFLVNRHVAIYSNLSLPFFAYFMTDICTHAETHFSKLKIYAIYCIDFGVARDIAWFIATRLGCR